MTEEQKKAIKNLEWHLERANHIVVGLARTPLKWLGYLDCKSSNEAYAWRLDLAAEAISKAEPRADARWGQRAYCPLCGQGTQLQYEEGFALPVGLESHLLAVGRVTPCVVMEAAFAIAENHWSTTFRAPEAPPDVPKPAPRTRRGKA